MAKCPVCGIDEAEISIPDATDAIRTFPRRYREALADVPDDLLKVQPDPDTWSMLGYAVHAREVLELLAGSLPLVLNSSGPAFPPIDVDDVASSRPSWVLNVDLTLAGITTSCTDLVDQITSVPVAAWDRPFTIGDDAHTAGWIPRHAAHEGAHHLRDIARVRAILTS
jgi:DinB superfamily